MRWGYLHLNWRCKVANPSAQNNTRSIMHRYHPKCYSKLPGFVCGVYFVIDRSSTATVALPLPQEAQPPSSQLQRQLHAYNTCHNTVWRSVTPCGKSHQTEESRSPSVCCQRKSSTSKSSTSTRFFLMNATAEEEATSVHEKKSC